MYQTENQVSKVILYADHFHIDNLSHISLPRGPCCPYMSLTCTEENFMRIYKLNSCCTCKD